MMGTLHLYLDESGVRIPNFSPEIARSDNMDYFAFGGALIDEEDIGAVIAAHVGIVQRWSLTGPLHSTKIRGRRKHFSWLKVDKAKESDFLSDLENTILALPIIGTACVVDRPGYVARYAGQYAKPWLLCKTAYAILIERAAKFASLNHKRLKIFFEEAGAKEDKDIVEYTKLLRSEGMPFDRNNSQPYSGLEASDFQLILMGEPNRITKNVPMIQFSDLILYPMAKGGYDPRYPPYEKLTRAGLLVDCHIKVAERPSCGIKYSCFDQKRNGPEISEPFSRPA
jgi:hypothetical protein